MTNLLDEIEAELERARHNFPAMASAHEGYAILAEEVDELWDVVKMNPKKHPEADKRWVRGSPMHLEEGKRLRMRDMRAEAIQVAAMAIRFIEDVCDRDREKAPQVEHERTPWGSINNCARANRRPTAECQVCNGTCPDAGRSR